MQLVNEKLVGILSKYQVTAEQYFVLLCLFNNRAVIELYTIYLNIPEDVCYSNLYKNGYILVFKQDAGYIHSNVGLSDKGKRFVKECLQALGQRLEVTSVDNWIDEYRDIFAPAKFSGGRPIKGDRKECIKKMVVFMNENPNYTKEIILKAAKSYITRQAYEGYKFTMCCDYFINKSKVGSTLAAECESILEKGVTKEVSFNHDI